MAQLANCPQCDHDLLVPEGVAAGAWARCPSCRAFFQLKDAKSRELSTLELVESAGDADLAKHDADKTQDLASLATWTANEKDNELSLADESDSAEAEYSLAGESKTGETEGLDFADLEAMFSEDDSFKGETLPAVLTKSEPGDDLASLSEELHIADVTDDEPLDLDLSTADEPHSETVEAAAERIDAWFRSAKTVADMPPLGDAPSGESETESKSRERETEFVPSSAATNATIDLSSGGIDELSLSGDFELESPADESPEVPAWDDSQRMEQLLAGVEDLPSDEFDEAAEEATVPTEQAAEVPAAKWTPEETVTQLTRGGKPRRKRSFATTFAMTVFGGLVGLSLGYYGLLWYRGPAADFLNWANHLPKAMLPESFGKKSHVVATAPVNVPTSAGTTPAPAAGETAPKTDEAVKTAGATAEPNPAPAEQQASFNAPATEGKPAANEHDLSAVAATTVNKPAEPAPLDAPPAEPLKEAAPAPEPIQIHNAPSFTEKDLASAIMASKDAGPNLMNGNLADNTEIAKKKGASYALLADLAQKVTFVDPTAPNVAQLRQTADTVFGETLVSAHAREEVAQIAPMWLTSPRRRHGGVFFAGSVVSQEATGSYSVCNVDLGNGHSLPVVVPAALGERLKTLSGPVAVVGWIIDKPAESINGVPATAPHAVYAGRIIAIPQE